MICVLLAALLQAVPADSGEVHLQNIRQLTFGGQNAEAYFSHSGHQIIFQRQEADSGCDQEFVMNTDGTGLHRGSNGKGRTTCGYFFDDDRRVFYATTQHAGVACPPRPDYSKGYVWALYDYDIYVANADGQGARRITTNPHYDAEGTLSPDGKQIVYRAWHPQTTTDSTDYRGLIAQNLVRPVRMEIWVMDADGSQQRQVTNLGGANFAPYFHPDGKRIIFASNYKNPRSRHFDLYLVNADGSNLEQITTNTEFDAFPMFSPDGRQLVWASNRNGKVQGETNIFIADWIETP